MTDLPWLTLLIVVPLVGAAVVACLPGKSGLAKPVALGVSLLTLGLGVWAALSSYTIGSEDRFQLTETHEWIPQFGVSYALGVDGISLALILMALVLTPICLLAAWDDIPEGGSREKTYFALLLSLVPFMVGVFAAVDVFLFYVFFEAMLIPVYFLIGMFGGERRQAAAVKFLLFSLAGGLIMLVGVIALYVQGPGGSDGFLLERLTGLGLDGASGKWLFLAFFIAFAVKAPMWPVHTWLPDAAAASRPAVATLLVGVLDKVGTYGMIRFCLELFPEASRWATPAVLTLAVISVLYGAVLAVGQTNLMRLIAFTSISHFGFIVIGIFALTSTSQAGANLYMINHGFSTAALFLIAGMLIARRGSARIDDFGGWQRVTPALSGVFLIAGLSALALPGLASFVSEFLVIVGTFQRYPVVAVISALGVVLAAIYILLAYKRMMTGPPPTIDEPVASDGAALPVPAGGVERAADSASTDSASSGDSAWPTVGAPARAGRLPAPVPDLDWREKVVVAPLIASFLILGFFPGPVLDVLNPAVDRTLQIVGVAEPSGGSDSGSESGLGLIGGELR